VRCSCLSTLDCYAHTAIAATGASTAAANVSSTTGTTNSNATTTTAYVLSLLLLVYRAISLRPGQPELALLLVEVLGRLNETEAAGQVADTAAAALDRNNVPADVSNSTLATSQLNLAR
jgi:hypothetical protein